MSTSKLITVFVVYSMFYLFVEIESSFIKPNNVPRVGRSNEAESPFENDQGMMGYVIKTNKNIPRMGRRNYDSENRYDIPKFYEMPIGGIGYEGDGQETNQEQTENYYKQFHTMK